MHFYQQTFLIRIYNNTYFRLVSFSTFALSYFYTIFLPHFITIIIFSLKKLQYYMQYQSQFHSHLPDKPSSNRPETSYLSFPDHQANFLSPISKIHSNNKNSEIAASQYSYQRQGDMFSSYVTKGKIKNNLWKNVHHERSPKHKIGKERIGRSKIEEEVEEKSFEKIERENQQLRKEVQYLKGYIRRMQKKGKESSQFIDQSYLKQQSNQHIHIQKYCESKNIEDKDEEIFILLKDAQSEIRFKNEKIQRLQQKLNRYAVLSKQQTESSTPYKPVTPQNRNESRVQELLGMMGENDGKIHIILQKTNLLQQQIQVLKSKFVSLLELASKKAPTAYY